LLNYYFYYKKKTRNHFNKVVFRVFLLLNYYIIYPTARLNKLIKNKHFPLKNKSKFLLFKHFWTTLNYKYEISEKENNFDQTLSFSYKYYWYYDFDYWCPHNH